MRWGVYFTAFIPFSKVTVWEYLPTPGSEETEMLRLIVGEATGMMAFDKRQMVLFLELRFRPTGDSHLGSGNGGRID